MNPDESIFIFRHAIWLLFVIATFVNAAIWWFRGRRKIAKIPALKWGYRRLIRGYLIFGMIPWLILGAAIELPERFRGPLIVAFALTIPIYWILGLYWLVFRGGAEDLAAHPWSSRLALDPRTIKAHGVGLVIAVFVALVFGLFALTGVKH
jgi:hypothetical protein